MGVKIELHSITALPEIWAADYFLFIAAYPTLRVAQAYGGVCEFVVVRFGLN